MRTNASVLPRPQSSESQQARSPALGSPIRRAGLLLAVLLTGQALANIDAAIVNVATASIHLRLGATGAELQLVVSGYILAYAMLMITGARLGHRYGYRRIFLLGVGGFTLASLACGLAPSPILLVVARIIQGAGAALLVPQVLSGIQIHFAGEARARALGLFVVALSVSAVAGQILGGALISADLFGSGWRPVFLINVPIGAALIAAAMRCLPADAARGRARLDLGGVAVLSTALLLALVPLILGREAHWPAWMWVCLLASLPAFALFVAMERRIAASGGDPLVNLRILVNPAVSWALISRALAAGTYFSLLFVLALYLQQGLGETPLSSGLSLVTWVGAFGIGGPLLHRLPKPVSCHAAWAGASIMAAAFAAIAAALMAGKAEGLVLVTLLGFGGFGFGLTTTSLLTHLTSVVPAEYAPDISGLYQTNSQLAAAVGVALFGIVYLDLTGQAGRPAAMQAFTVISIAFAATALLAALAARRATRQLVA